MNIKNRIEELKQKIFNLDFNFTKEELSIIDNYKDVYELLKKTVEDNVDKVNFEILKLIVENTEDTLRFKSELIIKYLELWLERGLVLTYETVDAMKEELDNDDLEIFRKYCIEETLDFDSLLTNCDTSFVEEDIYQILLDNKRYDILQKIDFNRPLDPDIIDRLIKEFPYEQYPNPIFIENLELKELLRINPKYIKTKILLNKFYNENNIDKAKINPTSEIYRIILTCLENETEFHMGYDEGIEPLISDSNEERNKQIFMLLSKKGSLELLSEQRVYDDISIEEIKRRLMSYINNGDEIPCSFLEDDKLINEVLSDSNIIQQLINKKELNLLLYSPILDKYIDNVKEMIINNKEYFNKYSFYQNQNLIKYPEVLKLFVDYERYNLLDTTDQSIPEEIIEYFIRYGSFKSIRLNNEEIKKYVDIIVDRINNDFDYAIKFEKEYLRYLVTDENTYNKLISTYIKLDESFIEKMIDIIIHNGDIEALSNHDNYLLVKDFVCKKYNFDPIRLDILEQKYGSRIISYFENETITELLNLPDEEFNKIINLFNVEEYKIQDIEAIYDSVEQHKFQETNPEVFSVFNDVMHSIDEGNDNYIQIINNIKPYLDEEFFKSFNEYSDNKFTIEDVDHLLNLVIKKLKDNDPEKVSKYTTLLHFITSYYIKEKREEKRNEYDLYGDVQIPRTIDFKRSESVLISAILDSDLIKVIEKELTEEGFEKSLFFDCVNYYKDKNTFLINDPSIVKSNIKVLVMKVKQLIEKLDEKTKIDLLSRSNRIQDAKYNYTIDKTSRNPYEILSILNIKAIQETILNNEDIYNELKQIMDKKKLMTMPKSVLTYLTSSGYSFDQIDVSVFVSYFNKIYKEEKKRLEAQNIDSSKINMNVPTILAYIDAFGSFSSIYKRTLGEEDARLIKTNPGPNSAYRKTDRERLEESLRRTVDNFNRKVVTIPTYNELLDCGNDKQLRVVCGNFTHPSTLTHGERTGACMRIGGVGETLYKFCLENENGFHIRFEDPTTGEYISRVSGFRSGNTVFLNELRDSCNPERYTNNEIEKACENASKLIVELSKNSDYPIENVVVHRAYAMAHSDKKDEDLNVDNIKEGFEYFYTDVNRFAIVMATSSDKLSPVELQTTGLPKYLPAREITKKTNNKEEIINSISRIEELKIYMNIGLFDFIEDINFEEGFIEGYYNQDWYAYVDNNKVIHSDIITEDYRAQEELRNAIEELNKKYSLGGEKHEL